jgi:hypothetical protein
VTATRDELWKSVNHVPVSALASYAGSAVVLASAFVQPSLFNSALSLGSAAAMAFFAAETHRGDPMTGHKHSTGPTRQRAVGVFSLTVCLFVVAVVSLFVTTTMLTRTLRSRSPATAAVTVLGAGLSAMHFVDWRRYLQKRVDLARSHFAEQSEQFRQRK